VNPTVERPPDVFTTHRLLCRRTRLDDAVAILASYAGDAEVTRFLSWKPHASIESVAGFLGAQIAAWEKGEAFRYELCLRETDLPIGAIGLHPEGPKVSFGYVLAKAFWGRGLMVEPLEHLVSWALSQPGIYRAYAFCDVENRGSARVMEKAGMTREGILRRWHVCPTIGPEPRDCIVYARTR
jgi:RimJ/RimL family protein N-acetyltransferase